MVKILKNIAVIGFLVLFLPYTATLLMGGRQGIHQEIPLSDLEYQVLCRLIREDCAWMEEGMMDLMAILYRTEYVKKGNEETGEVSLELYEKNYDRAYEAVVRTKGQAVTIDGAYKELPYHAISGGSTRDGRLLGEEYEYVLSVACPYDLECDSYLQSFTLTKEELCGTLGQEDFTLEELSLVRDSADYVTTAAWKDQKWQGETFRTLLHLPSSNIWMEEREGAVRVTAKGSGHGFGISLYTANRMIQEGKDISEIFQYFYENAECITIP